MKCKEVSLPSVRCYSEDSSTKDAIFGDNGLSEGAMEDSEISGASTLLKMQQSSGESFRGLGNVLVAMDQNKNNNGKTYDFCENLKASPVEEIHRFVEGDFVWGKIKSHPWWPGRVYHPSNASQVAKKIKQRGKILVTYFGDGTFAWCHPWQLKHLEDNFPEMLRQSTSKNFLNAVDCLLDEFGKLLVITVSCSCVPLSALVRPLADNFGVEEGVVVPEDGVDKFSNFFDPSHCIAFLKDSAQLHSSCDMLELTVIKSWLSVFYLINGGHHLPTYGDPQPIPGFDEEEENDVSESRSLNNFPVSSDDRLSQKRKQKSIADIIGVKQSMMLGRKKRSSKNDEEHKKEKDDSSSESQKFMDEIEAADLADKGASCRRRKKSKYLSAPFTSDSGGVRREAMISMEAEGQENSPLYLVCERENQNGIKLECGGGAKLKDARAINVGAKLNDVKARLEAMTGLLDNEDQILSSNLKISLQGSVRDVTQMVADLVNDFQQD